MEHIGDTVATVVKVTPQQNTSIKSVVNIYTLADDHFEHQAMFIKKLFYKYRAKAVAIDGNGLGIGLIDYMVKTQVDNETNDTLNDFGIINDEEGFYKRYRTENTERDAVYIIKANATINTEAHANVQTQMATGHVKFLISERDAKSKLLESKKGQNMTPEARAEYLMPFTLTDILREEILNLKEDHEGINIILKPANRAIRKDKFSSLEYALYYIKLEEDSKRKKRSGKFSDFMFLN